MGQQQSNPNQGDKDKVFMDIESRSCLWYNFILFDN